MNCTNTDIAITSPLPVSALLDSMLDRKVKNAGRPIIKRGRLTDVLETFSH